MSRIIDKGSRFGIVLGFVIVALLSGPVLAGPAGAGSIEKRLQQYETRFNQGDAAAVAALYSEDVVYYDPMGRVHRGRQAVERYYQQSLAAGFSDMTIEKIEIEVLGDTAYDVARYTIADPRGEPLTGYHLAILAKEDGEWVVQRTLVNTRMPGPPGNGGGGGER